MKIFVSLLLFLVLAFFGFEIGTSMFSKTVIAIDTSKTSGSTEFSSKDLCHRQSEICFSDYHCCSHYCANNGQCSTRDFELTCKRNGLRCSDSVECCSGSCLNNTCFGTTTHKSRVGEPCIASEQCQSGSCGINNRCDAAENDCLPAGFRAADSYQCCSRNLRDGFCIGSSSSPSPSGSQCNDHYECASGGCLDHICR